MLLTCILFVGCESEDKSAVYLRISNTSEQDFNAVLVQYPGITAIFDHIDMGELSDYTKLELALERGFYQVEIVGGVMHQISWTDYDSIPKLAAGYYTLELNIVNGNLHPKLKANQLF